MMQEREKIENLSPFERLKGCFEKMTTEDKDNPCIRSKKLEDGTLVLVWGFRDFMDDSRGSPILNEYRIVVKPLVSPESIKDNSFSFTIRENSTLKSISMPISTFVIGNIRVPLMHETHDGERRASQKDHDSAFSAAKALVNWFCEMMEKERYIKPAVSIAN